MKKLRNFFLILASFAFSFLSTPTLPTFADADNFYFKDYTADFYLKKAKDGTSEMDVVEKFVAVFPDNNQNHGITKDIPFLNQNDTNITMKNIDAPEVEVLRNGETEPFSYKTFDDHFSLRIGSADTYLHGEQTYILKYKFIHVITDFKDSTYSENPYQELYWDANGNDWGQKFNKVTVNLHLDKGINNQLINNLEESESTTYKTKDYIYPTNKTKDQIGAWCYVGKLGSADQPRCNITDLDDGIKFESENLSANEDLTFVTNFKPKTFKVPENNYVKSTYLKNFSGDYKISKDPENISTMNASEKINAVFPTKNIAENFTRKIPFTNQGNANYIIKDPDNFSIKVSIDGKKPIELKATEGSKTDEYSTPTSNAPSAYLVKKDGYYLFVYIDGPYLHGEHTFDFNFDYYRIATNELDDDLNHRQLISLDTSSYGLPNRIDKSVISVHVPSSLKTTSYKYNDPDTGSELRNTDFWCNVRNKEDNCAYDKKVQNGETVYRAAGFAADDNSSFNISFAENTFTVPDINHNYLYYIYFGIVVALLFIAWFILYRKEYKKAHKNFHYVKDTPVVVQYLPPKDYTVAEMGENYLGKVKNIRVATLLELIVGKRVKLKKTETKLGKKFSQTEWTIIPINLEGLSAEQLDLLEFFKGERGIIKGEEIKIKTRIATNALESISKSYNKDLRKNIVDKGLVLDAKERIDFPTLIITTISITFTVLFILFIMITTLSDVSGLRTAILEFFGYTRYSAYEGEFLVGPMVVLVFLSFVLIPVLKEYFNQFSRHTQKGLEASLYLSGLKKYIKMAEADRLKFLQSVDGADTSREGIVKLYEKLLPYAELFGLEKSWAKELQKYSDIINTDDLNSISNISLITNDIDSFNSFTSSASSSSSSSSGGGSSSSSGGGGGGYAGGGGGGGGGGGW